MSELVQNSALVVDNIIQLPQYNINYTEQETKHKKIIQFPTDNLSMPNLTKPNFIVSNAIKSKIIHINDIPKAKTEVEIEEELQIIDPFADLLSDQDVNLENIDPFGSFSFNSPSLNDLISSQLEQTDSATTTQTIEKELEEVPLTTHTSNFISKYNPIRDFSEEEIQTAREVLNKELSTEAEIFNLQNTDSFKVLIETMQNNLLAHMALCIGNDGHGTIKQQLATSAVLQTAGSIQHDNQSAAQEVAEHTSAQSQSNKVINLGGGSGGGGSSGGHNHSGSLVEHAHHSHCPGCGEYLPASCACAKCEQRKMMRKRAA